MQKKIIALAVAGLVSGGAFAQSSVTVSGLFDTGINSTKTTSAAGVTTKTQRFGSSSGSATTNLTFAATEDLGGGMKAGVLMETDPVAGSSNTATSLNNSQNYLWVSGSFGEVKAGLFNHAGLTANLTSQPFGTGMGGGYGGNFHRLDSGAITNGSLTQRSIRTDNSIQYTTPDFSGFKASLLMHKGNADAAAGSANLLGDAQQIIGLTYNNGPLNVAYTNDVVKGKGTAAAVAAGCAALAGAPAGVGGSACAAGTVPTTAATAAASALGNGVKMTHNMLGANYTFGAVTGYFGYTTSKNSGAAAGAEVNARSMNLGAKYTMGNLSFLANFLRDNDKTVGDDDRKLNALGVDYAMSKRTTAYVRIEKWDNDTKAANNDGSATQVGIRHAF